MAVSPVTIKHIDASKVMEMVRELRQHGLVQGKDFDFKYCPAEWDTEYGVTPKRAEFYFYKEKWQTFFAIKYAC